LQAKQTFLYLGGAENSAIRLVTSWATNEDAVLAFNKQVRKN